MKSYHRMQKHLIIAWWVGIPILLNRFLDEPTDLFTSSLKLAKHSWDENDLVISAATTKIGTSLWSMLPRIEHCLIGRYLWLFQEISLFEHIFYFNFRYVCGDIVERPALFARLRKFCSEFRRFSWISEDRSETRSRWSQTRIWTETRRSSRSRRLQASSGEPFLYSLFPTTMIIVQ